jgi:hypothetical protein
VWRSTRQSVHMVGTGLIRIRCWKKNNNKKPLPHLHFPPKHHHSIKKKNPKQKQFRNTYHLALPNASITERRTDSWVTGVTKPLYTMIIGVRFRRKIRDGGLPIWKQRHIPDTCENHPKSSQYYPSRHHAWWSPTTEWLYNRPAYAYPSSPNVRL